MTKLSRIPRLLLLPALCLAACTADEPATLNADGQALVIEDLRIAGSNTRADAQPIEGSFVEGSRLQATITYNGQSSTGQYTYNNNVWTSDADATAYWLSATQTQTVTLRTPYPDPIPAMPPAFNDRNWHEYDILEYSKQTAPTTSFTLRHTRAQLCVTLTAGTGLTDAELAGAKVTINKGTELWHTNGAHYALLDPATYATLPALTINLGGETYTYTPETSTTLTAGQCLMLTLSVSKAQVSTLGATSTGWQELTATGTEVAGVTVLYCPTPGSLTVPDNLSGQVYVTGTINNTDLNALKGKLANVTHLYIVAESGETGEGGLTVPEYFANYSTSLQAVAILHATSIGSAAFMICTSLESIELPAITSIEDYAFGACKSLTSIALPAATSIGNSTFDDCSSLESIELPAAETIGNKAFFNCTGLKSIDLPAAETIGDNAFEECSSLESIDLPAATSIGNGAFNRCTNLTSIDLPAATSIGSYAFSMCDGLESIDLPKAETIGENAFEECSSLESIELPAAETIGNKAFEACYSLESIDLPVATSIGDNAFSDCASLISIDLPAATSIGSYAFSVCDGLESIELPAATSIGSYAFSMCDGLTSIELPEAETIGEKAFEECSSLESIDLPAATSIGNGAFNMCTSLKRIAVPSTATAGSDVFSNSPTTTLFLTDEETTADTAAGLANWGGVTWQTIYYGYQGSGDYLEPGSYEGQWTINN